MEAAQYSNPKHFNAYTAGVGDAVIEPSGSNGGGNASIASSTNKSTNNNDGASNSQSKSTAGRRDDEANQTELTSRLSKYTRGSDRRQVLRTLKELLPRLIDMKAAYVEDIAAAEREAAGERAILNGVKFLAVKHNSASGKAGVGGNGDAPEDEMVAAKAQPEDSYFLQTLREVCGHMCDMDGVSETSDPMALYGGLLLRLSRSASERDALEAVTTRSCGKGELVVLPLKRHHHEKNDGGGNGRGGMGSKHAVPIDVELYVEAGNVHARVTMRHELGLYKRTDLESHGLTSEISPWTALVLASQSEMMSESSSRKLGEIQHEIARSGKYTSNLRPWMFMNADVVEHVNFGSGSSVRVLHLSLPEDKNSGYLKR